MDPTLHLTSRGWTLKKAVKDARGGVGREIYTHPDTGNHEISVTLGRSREATPDYLSWTHTRKMKVGPTTYKQTLARGLHKELESYLDKLQLHESLADRLIDEVLLMEGYVGYLIHPESRAKLLSKIPTMHPEVIAHHITHSMSNKNGIPHAVAATVIGHAHNHGVHAAVVSINGSHVRHDGGIYHVTLSVDRSKGFGPKHSNDLLRGGNFTPVEPFEIRVEPREFK